MRIYLIRHGRQDSTACNANTPLSSVGKIQAELLGERLVGYGIDGLYSSDLIRAVETAQIAYETMQKLSENKIKLEHRIRPGIREFDFGDLTGKSGDVVRKFYDEYYQSHEPFVEDFAYPGGENGTQVIERAMPVIDEIIHCGHKNVAVVLHGGTIRALLSKLFMDDVAKRLHFGISLENCGITELKYYEDRQHFYLERFNDYGHLEKDERLLRKNWES